VIVYRSQGDPTPFAPRLLSQLVAEPSDPAGDESRQSSDPACPGAAARRPNVARKRQRLVIERQILLAEFTMAAAANRIEMEPAPSLVWNGRQANLLKLARSKPLPRAGSRIAGFPFHSFQISPEPSRKHSPSGQLPKH